VSYDCDLGRVRKLLEDIARQNPDVLVTPEPIVLVTDFGDNAVNLALRVSTSRAELAGRVKSDLLSEIYRIFREQKIELPFPQRDLHIRSVDTSFVVTNAPTRGADPLAAGGSAA
jgi:potassium efflux system protein